MSAPQTSSLSLLDLLAQGNVDPSLLNLIRNGRFDNQINKVGTVGLTPLHMASKYGLPSVVDALISKGADVNAKSLIGLTPLHYAAKSETSNVEVVKVLIASKADISLKDNDGKTALDYASKKGCAEVVGILSAAAKNPNASVGHPKVEEDKKHHRNSRL